MLIPTEWLQDFVRVEASPAELAERLTATGNEIEEIRESASGPVFYLKLTPNRADMLSIQGAGREVGALYGAEFHPVAAAPEFTGPPEAGVRVEVEAPDLCPRYVGLVIRGVKIGASPAWLQRRLEAVGLRAISSVVDATNYVMFELGQPLHAFDLDLLREQRILVRRARPGETMIAIDGTECALDPEMLVIADGKRAVAVAGVMGGQETEVSDTTVNILLESACFNPTSVRRTSSRLKLATAASYRFERGVDPNGVLIAARRAAQLITDLAGGTVSATVFDVYPAPVSPKAIRFRPERCRSLLGADVSDADAERFLTRLGMQVVRDSPECWSVTAPTFRVDAAIEEDLIEEVGRFYGYDCLPETLPGGAAGVGRLSGPDRLARRIRELLPAQGLYEAITNTLVARSFLEAARLERSPVWAGDGGSQLVALRNPLSEEYNVLRPSLLPGLLQAAQYNLRRGAPDVFLFEIGRAHLSTAARMQERTLIAGLLLGSRWSHTWNAAGQGTADFYAARGAAEGLARGLGLPPLAAEHGKHPAFHPGRTAWLTMGGERLGITGELHPEVSAALDLPRGVYLFELDGEVLSRLARDERIYEPPSRFPRALRDLALLVDRSVPSARIEAILREELGEWCRSVRLFDAYAGKNLPEGAVSLAYALELGADDRTLTDVEVEARLSAARVRLAAEVGAEVRGS